METMDFPYVFSMVAVISTYFLINKISITFIKKNVQTAHTQITNILLQHSFPTLPKLFIKVSFRAIMIRNNGLNISQITI